MMTFYKEISQFYQKKSNNCFNVEINFKCFLFFFWQKFVDTDTVWDNIKLWNYSPLTFQPILVSASPILELPKLKFEAYLFHYICSERFWLKKYV